jgi:hypothetical protein
MRILVQESLDLKLWLKRWGILKFWGLFVNFFGGSYLSEIIFQISGA